MAIVANELNFDADVFNELFQQELSQIGIKSEFGRIQQFYRLALLMHSDGVLHTKEDSAIHQISINMGMNPLATKRILKMMKNASNPMIDPLALLKIFQEQYN